MVTDPYSDSPLKISATAKVLRELVKPPVKLVNDSVAKFRWSNTGLEIRSVDGSNVIKVIQNATPKAFEKYVVEPAGEEFIIGVPCGRLADLLDKIEDESSVSIVYNTESRKLDIEFDGAEYSLAGVEVDSIREPKDNNLDFTTTMMVDSSVFQRACNIVGMASSSLTFEFGDGEATVFASGDTDDASISLTTATKDQLLDEDADVQFERDGGKCVSTFGRDFLEYVPSLTPDDAIFVKMSNDFPMCIRANRVNQSIPTKITIAPKL